MKDVSPVSHLGIMANTESTVDMPSALLALRTARCRKKQQLRRTLPDLRRDESLANGGIAHLNTVEAKCSREKGRTISFGYTAINGCYTGVVGALRMVRGLKCCSKCVKKATHVFQEDLEIADK